MTLLAIEALKKTYRQGKQGVEVLRGIDLTVAEGEFVALVGPSGSGKTTLMQLIGGLDKPSAGSVKIGGAALESFSDARLSAFRRQKLGFVFQFFHLLPTLSAEENVCLPLLLDGRSHGDVAPRAAELLERMGLGHRKHHRPDQLSGGEMQRVAIARALVADPLLVLADEPTGNLDSKTGRIVLELFRDTVKERGQTVIMVTHDPRAAELADRVIGIKDGLVERDERRLAAVA